MKLFGMFEKSQIEKGPEKGPEKRFEKPKDSLLSKEEALLYQDYAGSIEGHELKEGQLISSQAARKETYEEADQLIETLRGKQFDFLNIDWKKFNLKDAAQISNLEERLDAAVRMIAATKKDQGVMRMIGKYGKTIIPFVVAAKLMVGSVGDAMAQDMSIDEATKNHSNYDLKAYMPYKSNDGRLNWKVLLEPFALSFEKNKEQQRILNFDIPYEYSRLFDTGKQLNPEDYNKLNEYIKTQLEKQLKSAIYAFSFDEENYKKKFPGEFNDQDIKIVGISLVGYTSPEARKEGSEQIGAIDQENINLGNIRAENSNQQMERVFEELGIPYDKDTTKIQSTEIQFSDQEFQSLDIMAEQMDTTIFQLLKDYNDHKIGDDNISEKLDKIVGEKRKVGVMVEMKDGNDRIVIIPLPLLLALPLAATSFFLRRKTRLFSRNGRLQALAEDMLNGSAEEAVLNKETEQEKPTIKEIEKKPRLEMMQRDQILEFYRLDTLRDIVHNPNIYLDIARKYKDYEINNEDEAINSLAHEILQKWMEIDSEAREKVGLQGENYFEKPHQIMYAIFHAAVVKGFITEIKAGNEILNDDPVKYYYNIQKVVEKEFERFRTKSAK